MKAAKITIWIIVVMSLINWSRGDLDHKLPTVLPFMHGDPFSIYDVAGLIALGICLACLMRLSRNHRK